MKILVNSKFGIVNFLVIIILINLQIQLSNSFETEKIHKLNIFHEKDIPKSKILYKVNNKGNSNSNEVFLIDYIVTGRNFTMKIDQENPCNTFITDKLSLKMSKNTKIIEHLLVRNNATKIIPVNAFSSKEVGILGYDINEELFVANLYFDTDNSLKNNSTKFRSISTSKEDNPMIDFDVIFEYNAYALTEVEYDKDKYFNKFAWKFINENSIDYNYKTNINLVVSLLNNNFTKSLIDSMQLLNNTYAKKTENKYGNNTLIIYEYSVNLSPQELHILELRTLFMFGKCNLPLIEILYNNLFGITLIVVIFFMIIAKCNEDKPIKLNVE